MTVDYKILLTPLDETGRAYGTRIDVTQDVDISDYIKKGGIGDIQRELDQGNYDIGVFNYNSISLNINNRSGKFNESRLDWRSIFPSIRDRAIVEMYFIDPDSNETVSYEGLLTDKATRQDLTQDAIKFTFLGLESIFEQSVVNAGIIIDGMTFSEAFRAVLDVESVTTILTYDDANINPEIDLVIDDGDPFDNLTTKEAVDRLLFASNSVLLIDSNRNIIVKSRAANNNTPRELYLNDIQRRDNILSITDYNNGLQRMFNVVTIDGESFKNKISIGIHAERQKKITLGFVTTSAKREQIAEAILTEFALPRDEMMVRVEKKIATDWDILDKVTVSMNQIIRPEPGKVAPIYDIDYYDTDSYYPNEIGGFRINGNRVFKITGVFENPATFNTSFRLRDTGVVL
jgi:hypothetical protein